MFRFIAFIWDTADRSQKDALQTLERSFRYAHDEWQVVLECEGLKVFCAGIRSGSSEACVLNEGRGVVLGTLFTKPTTDGNPARRKTKFESAEERQIFASRGRALLESYWGRYVAILHDQARRLAWVIRDPSGGIGCLATTFHNVRLYFSSMDCPPLHHLDFSVNWSYVATHIGMALPDTRETAFIEVKRLLAGECAELSHNETTVRSYWNPFAIAGSDVIKDPTVAERDLRRVVKECVSAWASCYDDILHTLSGGLDSSIVLACLSKSPRRQNITCINMHYPLGANSDERLFARLVADRAGCKLIECESDPKVDLRKMPRIPLSERIDDVIYPYAAGTSVMRLARETRTAALFSGSGGDEIFNEGALYFAGADYVFHNGVRPSVFQFALNVARVDGVSIWSSLRTSIRRGLSPQLPRSSMDKFMKPSKLLSDKAIDGLVKKELFLHPWFDYTQHVPHGKAYQITLLATPYGIAGALDQPQDPEHCEPLAAQPVVELGLRIPTYLNAMGGWDRAMARHAFARDLPEDVVWRREKCLVFEFLKHVVAHNIDFVKPLLLDGVVVKEGLIDKGAMELLVTSAFNKRFGFPSEISKLISVELWHAHCVAERARAAA